MLSSVVVSGSKVRRVGYVVLAAASLALGNPNAAADLTDGACCNALTGQCSNPVAYTDCVAEGGTFYQDAQCSELEPACGNPGACCDDTTATCLDGVPELACLLRFAPTVACADLEQATGYACGSYDYLRANWTFDDGTATDVTGHGHDGTVHGAIPVPGVSQQALRFDGESNYIQVSGPVVSEPPYTVCAWVKPAELYDAYRYVISNGGQTAVGHGFYIMLYPDGLWEFGAFLPDGWGGFASTYAQTTNWQFLCGTWDGGLEPGSISFYVDGTPTAGNICQWGAGPAQDLRVGCASNYLTAFFYGNLDEIRIYDRALSEAEVQELYASQTPAGACCDETTGVCTEDVPLPACGGRFAAQTPCADLDPPCAESFAPGDLNCDGSVNASDIDPFVIALDGPDGYAAAYPDCDYMLADTNFDGLVNVFDIDTFVFILTGGE